MANKALFISSTVYTIIIFLFLFYHYNCSYKEVRILIPFVILGSFTSIFNHGTTNVYIKYLDRLVMITIILLTLYIIYKRDSTWNNKICIFLVVTNIFLFFLAKYIYQYSYKYSTYIHAVTHLIATILFIYIASYEIYLL
jgi:hypothetical protein